MKPLLLVLLLAACGCPQKTGTENAAPPPATNPTPTTPATPPTTNPTPPPTQGSGSPSGSGAAEPAPNWPRPAPGIGENCGDKDACAQGLTCVAYYGIAGARGPQFKTCEIKCTADAGCPADHKCVTIADGPGQVCRK